MLNFSSPDNLAFGQGITNHSMELERCKRFGFPYDDTRKTRRRIFFGSLIADDSWHTILAHAIESYDLYHTVALIESNRTINAHKAFFRKRIYESKSIELKALKSGIFGSATKVTVKFHVDNPAERESLYIWNGVEYQQREGIVEIWKQNGMTKDDIGIVADIDEFFSRDFLLAAQTCDIPEFRQGQDCKNPALTGFALIFEVSPSCYWDRRRWGHHDVMSGECIDKIGDSKVHKPGLREWDGKGPRKNGYGDELLNYTMMPNTTMYPLWTPNDFRLVLGKKYVRDETGVSAFHLHNFFSSLKILRNKYVTYGHPIYGADTKPLGDIHEDVKFTVNCLEGFEDDSNDVWMSSTAIYRTIPILFKNSSYIEARNEELREMMKEDKLRYEVSSKSKQD